MPARQPRLDRHLNEGQREQAARHLDDAVRLSLSRPCPRGRWMRDRYEDRWWDAVVDALFDAVLHHDPARGTFAHMLVMRINLRLHNEVLKQFRLRAPNDPCRNQVDLDLDKIPSREPEPWVGAAISEAARAAAPSA